MLSTILQILGARWRVILAATLSALVGGAIVLYISQPRYEASARVRLDFLRPDPITGMQVPSKQVSAYITSQIQMVRDFQVGVPAAEALGLFDDPDMLASYAARDPSDTRDMQIWVASQLLSTTTALPVQDSNLLEISYRTSSPEAAIVGVEAIRQAYYDASVAQRRQVASEKADALSEQATKLRDQIFRLEAEKRAIEQKYGVLLNEGGKELDSERLSILATGLGTSPVIAPAATAPRGLTTLMNQLEQQLASRTAQYGPNHPIVKELGQQRELLQSQIDAAIGRDNGQAAMAARLRAETAAVEALKTKVLSRREAELSARLIADQLRARKRALELTIGEMVKFRQIGSSNAAGITLFGEATVKDHPVFPNVPLILGGSGGLGLTLGVLLALLSELWDRRVRSAASLEILADAPVLGVIPLRRSTPSRAALRRRSAGEASVVSSMAAMRP